MAIVHIDLLLKSDKYIYIYEAVIWFLMNSSSERLQVKCVIMMQLSNAWIAEWAPSVQLNNW